MFFGIRSLWHRFVSSRIELSIDFVSCMGHTNNSINWCPNESKSYKANGRYDCN